LPGQGDDRPGCPGRRAALIGGFQRVFSARVQLVYLGKRVGKRRDWLVEQVKDHPVGVLLPGSAGASVGDDRLELRQGCHAGRPASVEGQVGEGFDEFVLGEAVGKGQAQVATQLVRPVGCGQDGDGDQAAVAGRQAGALPDVPKQNFVGELDYLGREVAEQPLGGALLFFHGGFLFSLDKARERYEGLTKAELSDQLDKRHLPKTGTVDELVERLVEADSK
jgi:hypothetical protein